MSEQMSQKVLDTPKKSLRKCRFCGYEFESYHNSQLICKTKECQRLRDREYITSWRKTHFQNGRRSVKDRSAYNRELYRKNPTKNINRVRAYNKLLRFKALQVIGGEEPKCKCGCDVVDFLEINHIAGGGYGERQSGMSNYTLYRNIINGIADVSGFDISCKLCNWLYYFELKYPQIHSMYNIKYQRAESIKYAEKMLKTV